MQDDRCIRHADEIVAVADHDAGPLALGAGKVFLQVFTGAAAEQGIRQFIDQHDRRGVQIGARYGQARGEIGGQRVVAVPPDATGSLASSIW